MISLSSTGQTSRPLLLEKFADPGEQIDTRLLQDPKSRVALVIEELQSGSRMLAEQIFLRDCQTPFEMIRSAELQRFSHAKAVEKLHLLASHCFLDDL